MVSQVYKFCCLFISIFISILAIPEVDDSYCKIISKDEKLEPTIKPDKLDINNKKWSFSLKLETKNCNELEAIVDIFYEREGNSILGQDYPNRIKIKDNQIKIYFEFLNEEDFVFPSDKYYYRVEINPDLQSSSILKKRILNHIIFDKNFKIGTIEEKQQYFIEYIEKLNNLVNLSNILFQKVTKSYFDKFMSIKSKFEHGACEKFRKQKAQISKDLLIKNIANKTTGDISDTMDENERKCEAWQNNLDRNWLSFESQQEYTPESLEENQPIGEEIKDKVDKTIEIDEQILNILGSTKIMPNVTKDTKTIDWMSLYYNAKQYIDNLYSRKIVFLPHILESISELYEKLKFFTVCLRDVLKDGSRIDLERWGNCPKDIKGDNIPYRKDFLSEKFNNVVKNILQRIYEAKYPEDIQKLRKDLNESIESIYNFFTQIQGIIKEKKPVPLPQAKHITENYNAIKKYLDDLKNDYKKGPVHPEYSEPYRLMNNEIIDSQDKLLDNFVNTFNKFAGNIKDFKGFPDSTKNYIKAVGDSLASLALHLKDSELNSILKKSWARIIPEYEPKEIEKIEVTKKPVNIIESIFDRAKGLVNEYNCTFKFEEDPQNPKQQKRVDMDILLSELKSSHPNNIKVVSDFILKQPYFNKVDDNTYLCNRRLSILWLKEVIHDDSYDSLITDSLQKYSEAILKLTLPSDYAQYLQLDSLIVEIAQIYDILAIKQDRALLLNQTIYDIKNITIKLLNDIHVALSNFYSSVENELKTLFDSANNDLEKLNTISSKYTTRFSIEVKDGKDITERKNILMPYIALLIKSLAYIATTKDSSYIKIVLPYLDAKYIDNERREIIKTTLEKIGVENFIPLQQFNNDYIQAIQSANKEVTSIQEKMEQLIEKIIKNAEKVNKDAAKTFDKALELATENDKKTYKELEQESMKVQIKNSIFCSVCNDLNKIRIIIEKAEEKINK